MYNRLRHKAITVFIALVWFTNGLYCKVLNGVPRHQQIVQEIFNLTDATARALTLLLGFAEIVMALWILSGYKLTLNAVAQILLVAVMNMIELWGVPHLLLWGKLNAIFALLFIALVYYNAFIAPYSKTLKTGP
ncbi:MAG TPA: DoxX-like family protein [Phnomibacter sp.]|nr:DoxX-like family protein [Phnomibacter sp.]